MISFDLDSLRSPCVCGETHPVAVKEIILREGALAEIPGLVERYGFTQPVVICDENTYEAAGKAVMELLVKADCIMLNVENLHADEHGVKAAGEQIGEACDLLIAVGSGTIHDITRYLGYHRNLPFFSVPTAASVDGFVSTVAAMTWNGFKKSFTAVSPMCVIADTDVIVKAPMRLSASGVADLLGKYTALADWKVSHIVTGEALCPRIVGLEEAALEQVKGSLSGLAAGEKAAYETLLYGLLLSGLAMQMMGNSRPASGAEHHLSHLWEMELINGHTDAYHGEKVGVGLCLACQKYHELSAQMKTPSFHWKENTEQLEQLLPDHINKTIRQELKEENTPDPLKAVDIQKLVSCKQEITDVLDALPDRREVEQMLEMVGAPVKLEDIGLPSELAEASVHLSPYVRKRITCMRLMKLV